MKQSKLASWIEAFGGTALGFVLALIAQAIFWPLLGVQITHTQNLISVGIMTVLSILRGYGWRRFMEAMHVRRPLTPFMQAVVAERYRQIEQEGWSAEHDDREHAIGEIAQAGAAYALFAARQHHNAFNSPAGDNYPLKPLPHAEVWPWADHWWKPADFRRNLVKACALVIADGEKFDRLRKRKPVQEVPFS